MSRSTRFIVSLTGLLLLSTAPLVAADAPPDAIEEFVGRTVAVELTRERTVVGVLLPRTNDRFLWLAAETIGVRLESGFPWSHVRTVVEIDPEAGGPFGPPVGIEVLPEPFIGPIVPGSPIPPLPGAAINPLAPGIAIHAFPGPVRSLSVAAIVGNFDADAESDGLSVLLSPLDARGRVVPVSGQVQFRLIVEHRRSPQRHSQLEDRRFHEIGHWSMVLDAEDFTPEGAILELPFRRSHPGEEYRNSPYALLTAKLSLPGIGVFEAEDPAVPLRPSALGPVPIDPQLQELRW